MAPLQENEQQSRMIVDESGTTSNVENAVDQISDQEELIIQKITSSSCEDHSDNDNVATHSRRGTFSYLLDDEEFLATGNHEGGEEEQRQEAAAASSSSCDDQPEHCKNDAIVEEEEEEEEEEEDEEFTANIEKEDEKKHATNSEEELMPCPDETIRELQQHDISVEEEDEKAPIISSEEQLMPCPDETIGGELEIQQQNFSEEELVTKNKEHQLEKVDTTLSTSIAPKKRNKSAEKRRKQVATSSDEELDPILEMASTANQSEKNSTSAQPTIQKMSSRIDDGGVSNSIIDDVGSNNGSNRLNKPCIASPVEQPDEDMFDEKHGILNNMNSLGDHLSSDESSSSSEMQQKAHENSIPLLQDGSSNNIRTRSLDGDAPKATSKGVDDSQSSRVSNLIAKFETGVITVDKDFRSYSGISASSSNSSYQRLAQSRSASTTKSHEENDNHNQKYRNQGQTFTKKADDWIEKSKEEPTIEKEDDSEGTPATLESSDILFKMPFPEYPPEEDEPAEILVLERKSSENLDTPQESPTALSNGDQSQAEEKGPNIETSHVTEETNEEMQDKENHPICLQKLDEYDLNVKESSGVSIVINDHEDIEPPNMEQEQSQSFIVVDEVEATVPDEDLSTNEIEKKSQPEDLRQEQELVLSEDNETTTDGHPKNDPSRDHLLFYSPSAVNEGPQDVKTENQKDKKKKRRVKSSLKKIVMRMRPKVAKSMKPKKQSSTTDSPASRNETSDALAEESDLPKGIETLTTKSNAAADQQREESKRLQEEEAARRKADAMVKRQEALKAAAEANRLQEEQAATRKKEEEAKRQEAAARRRRQVEERRKSIEDAKQKRISSRRSLFAWTKKGSENMAHEEVPEDSNKSGSEGQDSRDSPGEDTGIVGVLVVGDSDIELLMSQEELLKSQEDLKDNHEQVSETKESLDTNNEDEIRAENKAFPSIGIFVKSASSQFSPIIENQPELSMQETDSHDHLEIGNINTSHSDLETSNTKPDEDPENGILSFETEEQSALIISQNKPATGSLPQCLSSCSENSATSVEVCLALVAEMASLQNAGEACFRVPKSTPKWEPPTETPKWGSPKDTAEHEPPGNLERKPVLQKQPSLVQEAVAGKYSALLEYQRAAKRGQENARQQSSEEIEGKSPTTNESGAEKENIEVELNQYNELNAASRVVQLKVPPEDDRNFETIEVFLPLDGFSPVIDDGRPGNMDEKADPDLSSGIEVSLPFGNESTADQKALIFEMPPDGKKRSTSQKFKKSIKKLAAKTKSLKLLFVRSRKLDQNHNSVPSSAELQFMDDVLSALTEQSVSTGKSISTGKSSCKLLMEKHQPHIVIADGNEEVSHAELRAEARTEEMLPIEISSERDICEVAQNEGPMNSQVHIVIDTARAASRQATIYEAEPTKESSSNELDSSRESSHDSSTTNESYMVLDAFNVQKNSVDSTYDYTCESGLATYESGLATYESGLATYESGRATYDSGVGTYNDTRTYESGFVTSDESKDGEESRDVDSLANMVASDAVAQAMSERENLIQSQAEELERLHMRLSEMEEEIADVVVDEEAEEEVQVQDQWSLIPNPSMRKKPGRFMRSFRSLRLRKRKDLGTLCITPEADDASPEERNDDAMIPVGDEDDEREDQIDELVTICESA